MFYNNKNLKFLIEYLKNNNMDSIFVSSWNCIYSMTKEGYIKMDFSFDNRTEYMSLMESILDKYKEDDCNINDVYISSYKNIDIYLYKWSNCSYWITLKKR